jgi:hypothetical protein
MEKVKSVNSLSYGYLSVFLFLFLFLLDAIKYIAEYASFPLPPFGLIGLLLGGLFLYPFLVIQRNHKTNILLAIYAVFMVSFFLQAMSSFFFLPSDLWSIFRLFIPIMLTGYFMYTYLTDIGISKSIFKASAFLFFVLGIQIIYFGLNRGAFEGINYLRFSEGFLITSILLITHTKNHLKQLALVLFSIVVLYYADSRFTFFSYLIVTVIYFSFKSFRLLASIAISVILTIVIIQLIEPSLITETRYYRMLFSSSIDTSLNARTEMMETAWNAIRQVPLTGEFAYYRKDCEGCYAHNAFSYWFEFGIVGVLFIVFIINTISISLFSLIKQSSKRKKLQNQEMFFLLFLIHAIIGFLFSKHWDYISLFFVIGFAFKVIEIDSKKNVTLETKNTNVKT